MAFVDSTLQDLAECCPPLSEADHTHFQPIALSSSDALFLVEEFDSFCDGRKTWWGQAISAGMLRNDVCSGRFWFMLSAMQHAGKRVCRTSDGSLMVRIDYGTNERPRSGLHSADGDAANRPSRTLPPLAVPLTAPLDTEILAFDENMRLTPALVRTTQPLTVHKATRGAFKLSCNALDACDTLLFLGFSGEWLRSLMPMAEAALFDHDDRGLRVLHENKWAAVVEEDGKLRATHEAQPPESSAHGVHLHIHSKQSACVYLRRCPKVR